MQFINFSLASLIAYFGILAGIVLVKLAPEEQTSLKKYFIVSKATLTAVISLFLLIYFYFLNKWLPIIVLFLSFLFILNNSAISSIILGIFFYLSSKNLRLFIVTASLIFIYNIISSSISFKKRTDTIKLLYNNILFLIVANVLFLNSKLNLFIFDILHNLL